MSFHTPIEQRIGARLSMGLAGRSLNLTDTLTVVRLPDGWPESRSTGAGTTDSSRQHGGLTFALGMPFSVTRGLVIEPEIRWLQTIADEDFSARSIGVKTGWRF